MSPRVLAVALLAVAVALAGCGATVGPSDAGTTTPTATVTPTATATQTDTATSDDPAFPPGVTGDGVAEPLALTNAHATVLGNASFAVTANTTERYENGRLRTRKRTTATFARSKDRYAIDHVVAGSEPSVMDASTGHLSAWADGEGVYQRIVVGGSASYQHLRDANGNLRDPGAYLLADQIEEDRLYVLFSALDLSVERVTREGATRYRLTSGALSNPDAVASSFDLDGIDRANLTALVDSRGVVYEYRVEYVGSVENRTVRGIHEVRYDEVGSATVERPGWVDEAQNGSSG